MNGKKLYISLAVLVVVVAAIVGISVSHGSNKMGMSQASVQNAQATNQVTIQNYMFSPAAIKVKVGTTVTWTNKDSVHHTVTADTVSKDAPSSMDIAQGQSFKYTFKKAGTYTYHCFPHPYMHGTVEVTN